MIRWWLTFAVCLIAGAALANDLLLLGAGTIDPVGGGCTSFVLLNDGTSFILLNDGTSKLCLNS